jgi:hypothetical protein
MTPKSNPAGSSCPACDCPLCVRLEDTYGQWLWYVAGHTSRPIAYCPLCGVDLHAAYSNLVHTRTKASQPRAKPPRKPKGER